MTTLRQKLSGNFILLCIATILLSLIPRLFAIDTLLLDIQPYRQTQTAITVSEFVQHGLDMFNYKTPIFGPPFTIPFEFPFFQATAYLLCKLGITNIDTACRVANIFYFSITAFLLVLLVNQVFKSKTVAFIALIHFCFIPFSICWGRNCTIDFCALAFTLAYLYFFIKIWSSQRNARYIYLILCFITGCLAYVVKVTTAYPYALIVVGIYVWLLYSWLSKNHWSISALISFTQQGKELLFTLSSALFTLLIPFICLYLWNRHSDLDKMQSSFSYCVTSKSLHAWNFGLLSDKLSFTHWLPILQRINNTLFPAAMLFIGLVAFTGKSIGYRQYLLYTVVAVVTAFIAVFTFFNLYYIHDYYLIAVFPLCSVVFAVFVFLFIHYFRAIKIRLLVGSVMLLLCSFAFPETLQHTVKENSDYLRFIYAKDFQSETESYKISKKIASLTNKNDLVIITDFEWNSYILYYADRRGLMWNFWNDKDLNRYIKDLDKTNYALLVSKQPSQHTALINHYNLSLVDSSDGISYFKIVSQK
jgi:4-amino-4-deoxy-L-arabinose transferase-like glycosyltransferase